MSAIIRGRTVVKTLTPASVSFVVAECVALFFYEIFKFGCVGLLLFSERVIRVSIKK